MIENKLKPYPEYKDCGIDWLGQVPRHWDTSQLRSFTQLKSHTGQPDLQLLSVYRDYGVILRYSRSDNHNPEGADLSRYKVVLPGDLVLNKMKTWQGSLGVSRYKGIVSPAYIVCKLIKPVNHSYLNYLLRSRPYVGYYNQISFGVRVNQWDMRYEDFKQTPINLPPLTEQSTIVRYLNHTNQLIRRYINAKKKLIKLLNEQKQAIINQVVTRGFDPNARLKPSGLEWLGDVPERWEILRSRYVFREFDKRSVTGKETHLAMSQRFGLIPSSMLEERRLVSESYVGAKLCEKGDLILNRLKAHLGVFALAKEPGIVSPDYTVFRNIRPISVQYFEQVLRSQGCRKELRIRAKGIVEGFWRLYTDDFYEIQLPVPPLEEQHAIIEFLDLHCAKINLAIHHAEQEIALIQEYHTRLITDVVTGKLDVHEAAQNLPEELDNIDLNDEPEIIAEDEEMVEEDEFATAEEVV